MKKSKKISLLIKRLLFASFFLVCGILILQRQFQLIDVAPLDGYFIEEPQPHFSANNWFEGSYQNQAEKYINQNIGFRNLFVRIYNQIAFSLFNETSTEQVVIGKENYLYEKNYIKAYLGKDFIGKDSIDKKVYMLKQLQDTLSSLQIDLIVVLAAGKASYFPEFIPESYSIEGKSISNYDYYSAALKRETVNLIDFNRWFLSMKDTSSHALYPKYGIHWSKYGEALVTDSLIHYIEKKRNVSLAHQQWGAVEVSDTARDTDDDIERGMNLFFKLKGFPLSYPSIKFKTDTSALKPSSIVVADSYYWGLMRAGFSTDVFENGQFWFYNKRIHFGAQADELLTVDQIDPKIEVEKQDIVILMSTEANLYKFAFGFIDLLYNAYFEPELYAKNREKRTKRLNDFKEMIRNNSHWMNNLQNKANQQQIDVEKLLQLDAEYLLEEEIQKQRDLP